MKSETQIGEVIATIVELDQLRPSSASSQLRLRGGIHRLLRRKSCRLPGPWLSQQVLQLPEMVRELVDAEAKEAVHAPVHLCRDDSKHGGVVRIT
jgi:hypothetical protein